MSYNHIEKLEKRIKEYEQLVRNINNAMLPDPNDERRVSRKWIIKTIRKELDWIKDDE